VEGAGCGAGGSGGWRGCGLCVCVRVCVCVCEGWALGGGEGVMVGILGNVVCVETGVGVGVLGVCVRGRKVGGGGCPESDEVGHSALKTCEHRARHP
jgi:hypothetical protein